MKKLTLVLTALLTVALLCACGTQRGRVASQGGGESPSQAAVSAEATPNEAPAPSATATPAPEGSKESPSEPTETPTPAIAGSSFTHEGYEWTFQVIPDTQTADFVDLDNRSELEISAHPQPEGTKPLVIEFLACSRDGQPVADMDEAYTDIGIMGLSFIIDSVAYSTPVTHTITNTGVDGTTKRFYIYLFVPEDTADQPDVTVESV